MDEILLIGQSFSNKVVYFKHEDGKMVVVRVIINSDGILIFASLSSVYGSLYDIELNHFYSF